VTAQLENTATIIFTKA